MLARSASRPLAPVLQARRAAVDGTAMAALLLCSALFLFVDRAVLPIELWDESRNIVNALEMRASGWGLVTTYRGLPDLWNTKPPLAIWLMWVSTRLFGVSEWALRLPSMVAALATVLVVMLFVRRTTGSLGTALLAAAFLVLSPAMFGEHGARTADYDTVLLFFTTAYLCLGFHAIHHRPARGSTLALIAAAATGALLTKGVAGAVPAAGGVVYLVGMGRFGRVLREPRWAAAVLSVAGAAAIFLTLREAAGPGYIAAMWDNDVAGRFSRALVTPQPWSFYLGRLAAGWFSATMLVVLAPVVAGALPRRARPVLWYSLALAGTAVLVASVAASKLHHYILPIVPFLAIAAALSARGLIACAARAFAREPRRAPLLGVAALLPLVLAGTNAVENGIVRRYLVEAEGEGARSGGYGRLFERLSREHGLPVTVVDPGFANGGLADDAPVLRAYRLIWAARGLTVARATDWVAAERIRGLVASCDAGIAAHLAAEADDFGAVPGCVAIRR